MSLGMFWSESLAMGRGNKVRNIRLEGAGFATLG